jgi:glycosyltransferase involved in cell wall biosynthesis
MDRWWRPSGLEGDPRVTFTGWLDAEEMAVWYGKADILVVPSWYEPFGMVVLEGMLHGLAIAAANVGGPSEILVDGVTGRLFPPRDVPALGQVLIELAGSRSVRRRLGRQARLEVARSWAWPRVLPTLRSVYHELTPVERSAA